MTVTGHEDYDSLKPYIAITDRTRKNLRTRFRGAALAASLAARGGPCKSKSFTAVGPSDLLPVFVIRRPVSELPVRRTTKTASCLRSRL